MFITVQEPFSLTTTDSPPVRQIVSQFVCGKFVSNFLPHCSLINEKFNADDSPACGCNDFLSADWDCLICLGSKMMREL